MVKETIKLEIAFPSDGEMTESLFVSAQDVLN